eukprot:CAMPEP_0178519878 /NCGR_PEP_ID=MMETSP0696-20121128/27090_1 /TAXON_ID=265572 /ORGANISM="Extubocellulus spinifer, Strain CCMP396" /LENGTH=50 /DNA_ID=CAMNT_0020150667 /DNA_START=53 /DNA_END=205 /DNA_ORIENTATION=+
MEKHYDPQGRRSKMVRPLAGAYIDMSCTGTCSKTSHSEAEAESESDADAG